jgi:hypothetical protein
VVPLPCVATRALSGFSRSHAINSVTLDAVIRLGLAISAFGTCAITMMGSNLVGSKPSFG